MPLAEGPLTPRYAAGAFWTGEEVLIVGGRDSAPCPPTADCVAPEEPALRDAAAWNPATEEWRPLRPAPVAVGDPRGAIVGDSLFLLVDSELYRYRLGTDEWLAAPGPPGDRQQLDLVAAGNWLLAYHRTQEQGVHLDGLLDPATNAWTELPADPVSPAHSRSAVWTGREIVLLGSPLAPQPPGEPPLVAAAVLDLGSMTWRRLPEAPVLGGVSGWTYAGDHLANVAIGRADGGEVNHWGRAYPRGGMLAAAGTWSELPDAPEEPGGFTSYAGGAGEFALGDGWALHVRSREWTRIPELPLPRDAAAAVWTGRELVVWGGVAWQGLEGVILDSGAAWRP
jgi:hypothetical protein